MGIAAKVFIAPTRSRSKKKKMMQEMIFLLVLIFLGVSSGNNLTTMVPAPPAVNNATAAPPPKDDLASLFVKFLEQSSANDEKHTAAVTKLSAKIATLATKSELEHVKTKVATLKRDALHCLSGTADKMHTSDWESSSTQVSFSRSFREIPALSFGVFTVYCYGHGNDLDAPEFDLDAPSVSTSGFSFNGKVQIRGDCPKIQVQISYIACGKF